VKKTRVTLNNKRKTVLVVVVCFLAASATVGGLLLGSDSAHVYVEASTTPLSDASAEVSAALPYFRRSSQNYTRGSQPARGGVGVLKRLGVRSIVDLRSTYDHTDDVRQAAAAAGLNYYWMPTSVWDPPTDDEATRFVNLVGDQSKGPFFVFCSDGLNRTGEMSALQRVMNDKWTVEQALKEMDELGFSPYYYNLRQYVWDYARKYRPEAVPPQGRVNEF